MDEAEKYISMLQERFPNLNVKWNPPPHTIFELNLCVLEFSPKSKPNEVYPVEFERGLCGNSPEDNIQVLIDIRGEQLDSL